jgi:putative RecB family exonuclease
MPSSDSSPNPLCDVRFTPRTNAGHDIRCRQAAYGGHVDVSSMTSTSQGSLDGMPKALFSCSPSKLLTWLDCPRRFRLHYLEGRRGVQSWAHNSVGSSAHLALREWFDLDLQERTPERGALLVEKVWIPDGFKDDAQSQRWRVRVADMVHRYLESVDPTTEPIARERTVAFTTGELAVQGKVDRVDIEVDEERRDHAVVIDYKTGRHPLSDDDARTSLALALYVMGVRRTLKQECHRVELHHLPTGRVLAHEHDDASLGRHVQRADSIGREAGIAQQAFKPLAVGVRNGEVEALEQADALFPAQPGVLCGWCDQRPWCPEGQQSAAQRKPWDGLAEEIQAPPTQV